MNRHIKRLLKRGEPQAPPSLSDWREHNQLRNDLLDWMTKYTAPRIQADQVPTRVKEVQFTEQPLYMPFRTIQVAHKHVEQQTPNPAFLKQIIAQLEPNVEFELVNRFTTYNELVNLVIRLWLKNENAEFHIYEDSVESMSEGDGADPVPLFVGWAHGKRYWPLVCALVTRVCNLNIFDNMMECESEHLQETLEDRMTELGDEEEDLKQRHQLTTECWTKDEWPTIMKELFRGPHKLEEELGKASWLPKNIKKMVGDLIELYNTHEPVQKQADELDINWFSGHTEIAHDSYVHQVLWSIRDEYLHSEIDARIQSDYDNSVLFNYAQSYQLNGNRIVPQSSKSAFEGREVLRIYTRTCLNTLARHAKCPIP